MLSSRRGCKPLWMVGSRCGRHCKIVSSVEYAPFHLGIAQDAQGPDPNRQSDEPTHAAREQKQARSDQS